MKSKLGIHIGFFACIGFLIALFGSWVPIVLVVGYVLLREDNDFLRMSVVKALVVVLVAAVINALLGLIPDVLFGFINWLTRIFGADTTFNSLGFIAKVNQIFSFLIWLVTACKDILLLLLACFAVGVKTIQLPLVDKLIDKYVTNKE